MSDTTTAASISSRIKVRRLTVAAVLVLTFSGVALLAAGWRLGWFGGEDQSVHATFTVPEPGRLTISVSESGNIRAERQIVITSEVEGQTTILSLVDEGTEVEKGDLLIELDSSRLRDELADREIRVQNNEAAFISARENLAVVKNQAEADISRAELDARFAKEDLKMYQEGEHPKRVKELKSRIFLAEEELQRARQTFEGSKILFEERYISQNELQADELSASKTELQLELAREELALFEEYTHQRRLDELTSAVEQADMALERVRRRAAADLAQAEANLRARESELNQQRDSLSKNREQIEKTRIHAPSDGLVVYATSTRISWRGNQDPLSEGQQVRERQELIHLPATDKMMVQVKVPEATMELIRPGLLAKITVDALPGREYTGRVSRIAPLPDATSMFMNPDLKVYDTDVLIDQGEYPPPRTGMSCTVEIITAEYENAIFVPLHAVTRQGRQPVVYVQQDDKNFAPKPVEIGLDDNRRIHITGGLKSGEVVLLNPPMRDAETIREEREQLDNSETEVAAANIESSTPDTTPPEVSTPPQRTREGGSPGRQRDSARRQPSTNGEN